MSDADEGARERFSATCERMSTATRLITAEEFAGIPDPVDGSRMELIDGEVVFMSPPTLLHGVCCSKVDRRFGTFIDDNRLGTTASNDTGCILSRDPDTVLGPDFAYWSRERLPVLVEGYSDVPPDLVVEIVSPSDTVPKMTSKIDEYLLRGVRLAIVVDPQRRTAKTCRPMTPPIDLNPADAVTCEDVLPGFRCLVSDLLP